jgi:hypothetical protein
VRLGRSVSILYILIAGIAMPVYGQVTDKKGSVKGHIFGSNIARKMQLFLLDSAKSIKRSTNINGKGRYRFDAVPVGRYRLRLPSYDVHFIDSPLSLTRFEQ